MSTTYSAKTGDTFDTISRRAYGSERYAADIIRANPGVSAPFRGGESVIIPDLPETPAARSPSGPATDPDEVAIVISGERFRFWSGARIVRSVDAMDAVEFSAPFEPDAPGFKQVFRPFSFLPVGITVGGETLFTGTIVNVTPSLDATLRTVTVNAYSKPGALGDCTPPASAFPCEFDEMGLKAIAASLCRPFGIPVVFTTAEGSIFERVAVNPGEMILAFLADLARQRSLVISSTPHGALLFQQSSAAGFPAARLSEGASPVLSVRPSFNPQQYYSSITGLMSMYVGADGSQYTVRNPHLRTDLRPYVFVSPDLLTGTIEQAVSAKIARMMSGAVSYTVELDTWRDPSGTLWAPNTTVLLTAPGAMVYAAYEFLIRTVTFEVDGDKRIATLELIFPGAFRGEIPEAFPWDS